MHQDNNHPYGSAASVAKYLAEARAAMNLTTAELANTSGVPESIITEYETGNGHLTMADYEALCSTMRIDMALPFYGGAIKETAAPKEKPPRNTVCRHTAPSDDLKSWVCTHDDEIKPAHSVACDACPHFQSRYIEYPITVNGITTHEIDLNQSLRKQGTLVAVRPCGDEYGGKTFLGVYLGELPWTITVRFNRETGVLTAAEVPNPAMYIFELKRIVWGCASWWKVIDSPYELSEITDSDINRQWYVQLMKELSDEKKGDPNA